MMRVYIVAGEASGDRLGADAMRQIKSHFPFPVQFYGVGGPLMIEQGLTSLFPMEELSVMGVFEILPKIKSLLARIQQTVENIEQCQPDIVLSIDAPDFCFRVAKSIKKRGKINAKLIHYVAPTVWAWRPGRAKKIARFLDGLLCLFPFEPPYFLKEGLHTKFVGHPVMQSGLLHADGSIFKKNHGIADDEKTLGLFFGSRRSEVNRLGPVLVESLVHVSRQMPSLTVIVPTLPNLEGMVKDMLHPYDGKVIITSLSEEKWQAFKACDAAIAVSGTVGLELAVADVPHVIAYKLNPLTAMIVKRMAKVRFAHLANLLLDKMVVPEFIQEKCIPEPIAQGVYDLLSNHPQAQSQKNYFKEIHTLISPPSSNAVAEFIRDSVKVS